MQYFLIISNNYLLLILSFFLFCCEKADEIVFLENQVRDIDGNIYNTVGIGNQTWIIENLNTCRYRNGAPIPYVESRNEWGQLSTPAYCYYYNKSENSSVYGKLYNWYVIEDSRGICPEGWHIPTREEWEELVAYLGGGAVAGGKLKEAGLDHWLEPNEATNESCFTALPGGHRGSLGTFGRIQESGSWWTATEHEDHFAHAYCFFTAHNHTRASIRESFKRVGRSIRCIKD